MIHHFYHIYADGQWQVPLREHAEAVSKITEPIKVEVGIVAEAQENRLEVIEEILRLDWDVISTSSNGWEQETLDMIWANSLEIIGPVLYAHTKGAANPTPVNHAWRGCMTRNTIGRWEEAVDALEAHDLVGSHWLTPKRYPELVQTPYFGGNFWWARPDYLRTLPMPKQDNRHEAEAWVGQKISDQMRVLDLRPGWPGLGCRSH